MNKLFKNIPLTFTEQKPDDFRKKIQAILTYIGEKLYVNKFNGKPTPLKNPCLRK